MQTISHFIFSNEIEAIKFRNLAQNLETPTKNETLDFYGAHED